VKEGRSTASMLSLLACGLVVSGVAVWLVTRGVSLSDVGDAVASANPGWLLLGVVCILSSYPLLGLRWTAIVRQTADPPRERMVELVLVGAAVNNLLPGRLGEVARAFGLSRLVRRPLLECFGTVVVDRIADLVLFAACLFTTVWTAPDARWVHWIAIGGAIMTGVCVVALAVVAVVLRRRGDRPLPDRGVLHHVGAFLRGLDTVPIRAVILRVAAYTVAAWGIWIVGAWAIGRSVGVPLTVPEVLFATGIIGLGSAIPSAPGFVGTYHWLAASAVGLYGVGGADALAFAVLLHAAWFVPTTLVGSGIMVRRGLTPGALRKVSLRAARAG
jgi:glycosyltransferase 2 family protein